MPNENHRSSEALRAIQALAEALDVVIKDSRLGNDDAIFACMMVVAGQLVLIPDHAARKAAYDKAKTFLSYDLKVADQKHGAIMTATLIGKYFLAPPPYAAGMIEAAVDDAHYLVRYDAYPNGRDAPEALAVVALSEMITGRDGERLHWLFFDNVEHRAKYWAWITQLPDDPTGKPRVVPMQRN